MRSALIQYSQLGVLCDLSLSRVQLQALLSDSINERLLTLFHYEQQRSSVVNEAVYRSNAFHLMKGHEECFRMEQVTHAHTCTHTSSCPMVLLGFNAHPRHC